MYFQTVKDYAMKPLHRSLLDALKIESGNEIIQESFELYEKDWNSDEENPYATYNLTEKVEWKNIVGPEKIVMQGRSVGGCLDCIQTYIGTKYDKVKEYIRKA